MLHLRNTRVFPSSSTIKLYSFPLNKGKLMNRIRSFHQRVSGYGNLVQDVRGSKRFLSPKRTISTSPLTQFAVKQQTTLNSSDKYLHFNENDGYYKSSPFPNVQQLNIPLHEYVWRDLDKWQNYVATVGQWSHTLSFLHTGKKTTRSSFIKVYGRKERKKPLFIEKKERKKENNLWFDLLKKKKEKNLS